MNEVQKNFNKQMNQSLKELKRKIKMIIMNILSGII